MVKLAAPVGVSGAADCSESLTVQRDDAGLIRSLEFAVTVVCTKTY